MSSDTQSPPTMPGPEHRKLGVFLGRWHTTGVVAATASTPAATVDSIDTYEWYPGEFFLVHHADGTVGNDAIRSIEIMGYDPERQCYFAPFFDSTGGCGTEEIRLDGNTVKARHEKSDDGMNWVLWMEVILTKEN